MKIGDTFTISGVRDVMKNPNRRWFQFWKPRKVPAGLKLFTVTQDITGTHNG